MLKAAKDDSYSWQSRWRTESKQPKCLVPSALRFDSWSNHHIKPPNRNSYASIKRRVTSSPKNAFLSSLKISIICKEDFFPLQTKFFVTEKTVDMMMKEIAEQDPWVRKLQSVSF